MRIPNAVGQRHLDRHPHQPPITAAQIGGYDVGFGAPINTPSTTVRRNIANTGNTNIQVARVVRYYRTRPQVTR